MFKKKNNIYFKQTIGDYFYYNKVKIIFLSCAILGGIVIGILNMSSLCRVFTSEAIIEKYLSNFIGNKVSIFSFFFKRFLEVAIWFALIYALSLCKYIHFAIYLLFIYVGFIFGYTASILIVVYGVGGIFNLVVFFIPIELIIICFLMVFATVCIKMCNDKWCFGKHYKCSSGLNFNITTLCIIFGFTALVILLEAIIMPGLFKDVLTSI